MDLLILRPVVAVSLAKHFERSYGVVRWIREVACRNGAEEHLGSTDRQPESELAFVEGRS
jgi:hypothetical protein